MAPLLPAHDFQTSFLVDRESRARADKIFAPAPMTRSGPDASSTGRAADGLYRGQGGEVAIELRVDCVRLGVISGDLWRVVSTARHYVASFRTTPGERVG